MHQHIQFQDNVQGVVDDLAFQELLLTGAQLHQIWGGYKPIMDAPNPLF